MCITDNTFQNMIFCVHILHSIVIHVKKCFWGILGCYPNKLIYYNYFTTYAVKINVYSFISFRSLSNTTNGVVTKIKLMLYVTGCRPLKQHCNCTHYLPYNSKYSAFCPQCFRYVCYFQNKQRMLPQTPLTSWS